MLSLIIRVVELDSHYISFKKCIKSIITLISIAFLVKVISVSSEVQMVITAPNQKLFYRNPHRTPWARNWWLTRTDASTSRTVWLYTPSHSHFLTSNTPTRTVPSRAGGCQEPWTFDYTFVPSLYLFCRLYVDKNSYKCTPSMFMNVVLNVDFTKETSGLYHYYVISSIYFAHVISINYQNTIFFTIS